MFAALPALVLLFLAAQSASADEPETIWSATLTVQEILHGDIVGCQSASGTQPDIQPCRQWITDEDFTYDGTTYEVVRVQVSFGTLLFALDQVFPAEFVDRYRLIVNGKVYQLKAARSAGFYDAGDQRDWLDSKLTWAVGDKVQVKLVERDFPTLDAQPFDHTVQPVPASQRAPTTAGGARMSSSAGYCYTGDGNSATENVRYPDGRTGEVGKASAYIRSLFACN